MAGFHSARGPAAMLLALLAVATQTAHGALAPSARIVKQLPFGGNVTTFIFKQELTRSAALAACTTFLKTVKCPKGMTCTPGPLASATTAAFNLAPVARVLKTYAIPEAEAQGVAVWSQILFTPKGLVPNAALAAYMARGGMVSPAAYFYYAHPPPAGTPDQCLALTQWADYVAAHCNTKLWYACEVVARYL